MAKLPVNDAFMKALKAVNAKSQASASFTEEELTKQRQSMELASKLATPPVGVSAEKIDLDGVNAEWVYPDFAHDKRNVILYCHGGGYTAGGIAYARILAAKLALHAGLEVLSFEYELAPERVFPSQINEAVKMWDYLMYLGYGADEVIVAGDSAGGNMALELLLKLKEDKRKLPKALILFSPWTDMTASSDSYEEHKDDDPILTKEYIIASRNAYMGETDLPPKDPKFSPIFADFTGFPPTFIQVGEKEVLQHDSLGLQKKMKKNGVPVQLTLYEGGWHVFQQMPVPMAIEAMREVRTFIETII